MVGITAVRESLEIGSRHGESNGEVAKVATFGKRVQRWSHERPWDFGISKSDLDFPSTVTSTTIEPLGQEECEVGGCGEPEAIHEDGIDLLASVEM